MICAWGCPFLLLFASTIVLLCRIDADCLLFTARGSRLADGKERNSKKWWQPEEFKWNKLEYDCIVANERCSELECNIIYIHRAHCAQETRALSIILLKWKITFSAVLFTPLRKRIIEWYYGMLKESALTPSALAISAATVVVFSNSERKSMIVIWREYTRCHWPLLFIYNSPVKNMSLLLRFRHKQNKVHQS